MGYPEGHKERTRTRIVDAARRLWKTKGYGGASVDKVMEEAGLTRGGFYAHFKSKEDLFEEVLLENKVRDGLELLKEKGITDTKAQMNAVIDWYLDENHRDHPEEGCVLTTLSQEMSRHRVKPRQRLSALVTRFGQWLGGETKQDKGYAALAMMVGAVSLARAHENPEVSAEILKQAKKEVKQLIGLSGNNPTWPD
ncbi:MAG: TetR/AcrR family transcriptional regulator [Methylocystaceae bacterium]|nr:TetR/AcrR family transcriptional regulator [Methylocystaceae bacterium]